MGLSTSNGYKITDEYKKVLSEQRENIKKIKENEQKKLDNIRTMMEEGCYEFVARYG